MRSRRSGRSFMASFTAFAAFAPLTPFALQNGFVSGHGRTRGFNQIIQMPIEIVLKQIIAERLLNRDPLSGESAPAASAAGELMSRGFTAAAESAYEYKLFSRRAASFFESRTLQFKHLLVNCR